MAGALKEDVLALFIWISLWGLMNNIIDKYVRPNEYDKRIAIYSILFMIALIVSYFFIKKGY